MPLTEEDYLVAKALHRKQSNRLWGLADTEGMTFDNPEYAKAKKRLDITAQILSDYEQKNRKVDEAGKLTEPPKTRLPSEVLSEKNKGFNYHFEPSIAETQSAFRNDPQIAARLGVDPKWLHGIAVQEQRQSITDPSTMGTPIGSYVIPAKTHLDLLQKDDRPDNPYNRYREHLWAQRLNEAKAKGENLQRYQDIQFRPGQRIDYLAGGLEYNIDRRLAPAALGAADSMSLGQASPFYDAMRDLYDYEASKRGYNTDWMPPRSEDIVNRSPGSNFAGSIAAYAIPGNVTNLAESGLAKAGSAVAERVLGKGLASELAGSAVAGAGANAIEGTAGAYSRALEQGQGPLEAAATATENLGPSLAFGVGGAALGKGVSRAAVAGREALRDSSRMRPLRVIEQGGGRADFARGVVPPPETKEFIKRSNAQPGDVDNPDALGSPRALAAQELAPQVRQHLNAETRRESENIHRQMQEYYNHPYYGQLAVDSKPVLDEMLKLAREEHFEAPVSGESRFADDKVKRAIGKEIGRISHVEWVDPQYAAKYAAMTGGTVVDHDLAWGILDTSNATRPSDVAVVTGAKLTAQKITKFEEKIDRALGFSRQSTTKDDPVFGRFNHAIKSMRDKLPLFVDTDGNLASPPAGYATQPGVGQASIPPGVNRPSGGPSAGPSPAGAPPAPAQPPAAPPAAGPAPSSAASTIPRQSAVEVALETDDFLPNTEELTSTDMLPVTEQVGSDEISELVPSGQELGSTDFIPESAEDLRPSEYRELEGRPTPRLRDLRRRQPKGPQRKEYDNYKEYLIARAKWRLQQGNATEADWARFQKAADEMPPTERVPELHEIPDTQKSVAPPAEESPLSLLAGNKLALDEPFMSAQRVAGPESLPVPNAQEWQAATGEGKEWYEDIVSPGRDPRSDEARRLGDLTNQKGAYDEANAQIGEVENRLGQMDDESKLKSILGIMSEKLGREITVEDLVRAGLLGGGAVALSSDDEGAQDAGLQAMAFGFGNPFKRKGKGAPVAAAPAATPTGPRELESVLDNGNTVRGFSALRNQQHRAKQDLEELERLTGSGSNDATVQRLIRFNQTGDAIDTDKALLRVAKELGLEKELRTIAATSAYPEFKERTRGLGGEGVRRGAFDVIAPRLSHGLEFLGGVPPNPFDRTSSSMTGDLLRRFLNVSGGRLGARHGNNLQDLWGILFPGEEEPLPPPP